MKVIDAMIKVSRREKVRFEILDDDNHIYRSTNGSSLYDETSKQEVYYWYIDENWLNREIKLIEEDKKLEKLNEILTTNDLECPITYNEMKIWKQVIKEHNKINELIDYINKEDK